MLRAFLAAAFCFPSVVAAQTVRGDSAFAAFERFAGAFLAEHKVPGAAIAIVRNDSIVFAKGFGVTSMDSGAPVGPETLFQLGSASKMFTAALIAELVAQGKLDVRAPVARYVAGLSPAIGARTLHDLLTHSSGLKDEPGGNGSQDESALAAYARTWPDAFALLPAGTVFSYSNQGYALAGLVGQEVTRQPFADLVQERVFQPLGMTRSTYRPRVALTFPIASGHAVPGGGPPAGDAQVVRPFDNDTRIWPAGYAYASAHEVARFMLVMLNGGVVDGRPALRGNTITAMTTGHVRVPNIFDGARYGYGLFVGPYRGLQSVWHDGQMTGFSSYVRMIPPRRLGVVTLLNRSGIRMERLIDAAFEALGVSAQPAAASVPAELSMDVAEMAKYVGRYENRFPVEITLRDGKLHRGWFGQSQRIYKIGEQRFTVDSTRRNRGAEFGIVPAAGDRPAYVHAALWAFVRRP
ncbi:MAG TPA: serine hydrolase [Gemmatimonadaceae bacterium]|nr:serine hydrolase [Gemmatimonadaceae bacterium]